MRLRACLMLLVVWLLPCGEQAFAQTQDSRFPPAPMQEQVIKLSGDPMNPVALEVTLFTPPGKGPFPLAVLLHGANHVSVKNRGERHRFDFLGDYFLSRGYMVALPMARGFAGSGGRVINLRCNIAEVGRANARDMRAVLQALQERPEIDRQRVVFGGQSFGGWTSLALTTDPPPGVRGVVAFVPALRESDCPREQQDQAMANGATQFGAQAKLPSLWVFGSNDSLVPTELWHRMFDYYRDGGAQAELLAFGKVNQDSHQILSYPATQRIWVPKLDEFLARLGLPSAEVNPQYLPKPTPPPSGYASIDDLTALPKQDEKLRDAYRAYLDKPVPKAFALSANGAAMSYGGFDPIADALRRCQSVRAACHLYAVDNDVVWKHGEMLEVAGAQIVARKSVSGQIAALVFSVNIDNDCKQTGQTEFVTIVPPTHGTASVFDSTGHTNFSANDPRAGCNSRLNLGRAYAYRGNGDFIGKDRLIVEERYPTGARRRLEFDIDVLPPQAPTFGTP